MGASRHDDSFSPTESPNTWHLNSIQIGPSNYKLKMPWSHIESDPRTTIRIAASHTHNQTQVTIQIQPITSFNKSSRQIKVPTFPIALTRYFILPPSSTPKVSTAIYLPRRLGRLKSSARRLCWSPPIRLGPVIMAKGCLILTAYHSWNFLNRRGIAGNFDKMNNQGTHQSSNLLSKPTEHVHIQYVHAVHGYPYEWPCQGFFMALL